MSSSFVDIYDKFRKPSASVLREALEERNSFSTSESNFITYMAGFSHYEFTAKLLDEFGLKFLDNTSILFDTINKKLHIKILISDQFDLGVLSSQILEMYQLTEFTNYGFYIDKAYDEIKKINHSQFAEYKSDRTISFKEEVFSYETDEKEINLVIHFITIWRNIYVNLIQCI